MNKKIPFDKEKTMEIRLEIGIAGDDEEDIINILFDSTLADNEYIKVCHGYYIYNNTIGKAIFILLNNKAIHLRALLFSCEFNKINYIISNKLDRKDYLVYFNNK